MINIKFSKYKNFKLDDEVSYNDSLLIRYLITIYPVRLYLLFFNFKTCFFFKMKQIKNKFFLKLIIFLIGRK